MLISIGFLVLLAYNLYSIQSVDGGVALNGTLTENTTLTKAAQTISCAEGLQCGLITNELQRISASVQSLQDKAHTWAIFRHHIEALNDQMQSLEQKTDFIKRNQDEQYAHISSMLTSLEFSMNHMLGKVINLSNDCHDQANLTDHKTVVAADDQANLFDVLSNLQRTSNADHKLKDEIATRLSNILRHVQHSDCAASVAGVAAESAPSVNSKMADLMRSVDNVCNLQQTLQALERKINALSSNSIPLKDFKQLQALAKKNAKVLENILRGIANSDKRVADGLIDLRSMATELSTFTESSDLLLKRLEDVISRLHAGILGIKSNRNCQTKDEEGIDYHEIENTDNDKDNDSNNDDENDDEDDNNDDNNNEQTNVKVTKDKTKEIEFVQPLKTSCHELERPIFDGIYKFASVSLNEAGRDANERLCIAANTGAAWTVIQNRGPFAELENFNRSWAEYRNGFGRLDKDFWFGNEFVHRLTYRDDYELRVELEDFDGVRVWAEYNIFRLDSEAYNYNLLVGGHSGTAPDSLAYHNELDFSTYDRRHDRSIDACCACATSYGSGWWFNNCSEANLNGVYRQTPTGHNYVGVIWENWRGDYSLKRARMMIRLKNSSNDYYDNMDP